VLQVLQYQKTGELFVADLPSPQLRPGGVLVRNIASVISAGTERTSVRTAQASLVGKARSRPDLVRQVLDNVKREGMIATYEKVKNRLDNYKELGYSSAGIVLESSLLEYRPGDRVACGGVAYHAEEIFVPKNLVARVPDGVEFEAAAFTTISSIALQGVRQADVRLGEIVAVMGLGLLGLITVQLLKAAGCRVIGLDISDTNFPLAAQFGCDVVLKSEESAVRSTLEMTRGHGVDAVIVTASSQSSEPLAIAMRMARKRAKVVIVGAVGMELQRSPFYEKELQVRISCSYGPGRYDPAYEIDGHDYPIGYVRWTENRNMEAVLDLMAQEKLKCAPLITHRFPIVDALRAYDVVTRKKKERYLAIVLEYPRASEPSLSRVQLKSPSLATRTAPSKTNIGFIGAGNFAQSSLLPYLVKSGLTLTGVATLSPAHAQKVMEKFGFCSCTTDPMKILDDTATGTVFIATRHDSHAQFVCEALQRGKNVFVEKPLAISHDQLSNVVKAWNEGPQGVVLLTGFNRRFSKPWRDIKEWFADNLEPFTMMYRVNAGPLPPNHWLLSPDQGGRIMGEVCHFIDCLQFVTGAKPVRVFAESAWSDRESSHHGDNSTITVSFSDGSVGTIVYVAEGDPSVEKEYCEISAGGKTAIMKNFSKVFFVHNRKTRKRRYDGTKGHREEVNHFVEMIAKNVAPLLSVVCQIDATRATLVAVDSLQQRCSLDV
jgi:predicted dehydrogenase/threonine dehydrogenase-like Zn-dependent dehydrogenase